MQITKTSFIDHPVKKIISGYSMIEILIVVGIFAVLSIIATQSVILTLRGTKKGESVVSVKEDLEYAASTIERVLQNAVTITDPANCDATQDHIGFISRDNTAVVFNCSNIGNTNSEVNYVSGGFTYKLTSGDTLISACSFSCTTEFGRMIVVFDVTGSAEGVSGVEGATYTTSRRIFLQQSVRK